MRAGATRVSYSLLANLLHLPPGIRISGIAPGESFDYFTILMVDEDGYSPLNFPEVATGEKIPMGDLTVTSHYETVSWSKE